MVNITEDKEFRERLIKAFDEWVAEYTEWFFWRTNYGKEFPKLGLALLLGDKDLTGKIPEPPKPVKVKAILLEYLSEKRASGKGLPSE